MVQGGILLVKYMVFLFNFIFWLSGIGLVVAGTVIQIRFSTYINIFGSFFLHTSVILIVVGCIVAVVAFFGCCGAIRESYCMTMTFAVLLGVIFILELAAGIACYVLRDDIETKMKSETTMGLQKYGVDGSYGVTWFWDKWQTEMKCCGLKHWHDWNSTETFKDRDKVPESCCIKQPYMTPECNMIRPEIANFIHIDGCLAKLKVSVRYHIAVIGGLGCAVALIQILGICFACCLSKSILKDYEEGYYY